MKTGQKFGSVKPGTPACPTLWSATAEGRGITASRTQWQHTRTATCRLSHRGNTKLFVNFDRATLRATWLVVRRTDKGLKGQVALPAVIFVERHSRATPVCSERLIDLPSKASQATDILRSQRAVVNLRTTGLTHV